MEKELKDFYKKRHGGYIKKEDDERFLQELNRTLQKAEQAGYRDLPIEHPYIFVFGLPRSGTTLITQLIAHAFDIGYINNFMARFYLAPLHGIRLSQIVLGENRETNFTSDYARTKLLTDIHEFGYFWRYWLKKEEIRGITQADQIENEIDWDGLKITLANMQQAFGKGMVFKNIFGSYHTEQLNRVLQKVIWVYIRRDPLDSAISILEARRKYYDDLNTWWSYMPVEYEKIKNLDYWRQIAGQVYYLRRYYNRISSSLPNVITIEYKELTANPGAVLAAINRKAGDWYDYSFKTVQEPPESFPFRSYAEREELREKFKILIKEFEQKENHHV
ncbi:MAG TPA: hypothetical protein ENK44_08335 [Caldithrix abyssi]|uniref:Sulfotransferase n=1 Tax=Caldithrix abyssi TaxID=187145 RepID=A0A7V4U145_CALAY|nr:hypothetical protein [Caldithrix abyssi]